MAKTAKKKVDKRDTRKRCHNCGVVFDDVTLNSSPAAGPKGACRACGKHVK